METESTIHFITRCRALDGIRLPMVKKLCELYEKEGKQHPRSDEELTSAWFNGDRFRTDSDYLIKLNDQNAHNLASIFIHKLYVERDHVINIDLIEQAER